MNRSLQNNIRTIYVMGFFHSFIVIVPVFVPLLQGYGLSMSQVLQTQAIFALTTALFEVPSGYIADLWGRRPAILLGSVLNGIGFFSLFWADSFVDFVSENSLLQLNLQMNRMLARMEDNLNRGNLSMAGMTHHQLWTSTNLVEAQMTQHILKPSFSRSN